MGASAAEKGNRRSDKGSLLPEEILKMQKPDVVDVRTLADREPEFPISSTVDRFFGLTHLPPELFKYHVFFCFTDEPKRKDIHRSSLKRKLMQTLLAKLIGDESGESVPQKVSSDGIGTLYSFNNLDSNEFRAVPSEKQIGFPLPEANYDKKGSKCVLATIRRQPNVNTGDILDQAKENNGKESIEALNVILQTFALHQAMKKQGRPLVLLGKNVYFPAKPESGTSTNGIHLRQGLSFSIKLPADAEPTFSGKGDNRYPLVMVASVHPTTFIDEGNLGQFVKENFGDMKAPLGMANGSCQHARLTEKLKALRHVLNGLKVRYTYRPSNSDPLPQGRPHSAAELSNAETPLQGRQRGISGLGKDAATQTFMFQGKDISVKDHFEQGILGTRKLEHPEYPVANTGTNDKPVWIPLEMLWIEPNQPIHKVPPNFESIALKKMHEEIREMRIGFQDWNFSNLSHPAVTSLLPGSLRKHYKLAFNDNSEPLYARFLSYPTLEQPGLDSKLAKMKMDNQSGPRPSKPEISLRKIHFLRISEDFPSSPDSGTSSSEFGSDQSSVTAVGECFRETCVKFTQALKSYALFKESTERKCSKSGSYEESFHQVAAKDFDGCILTDYSEELGLPTKGWDGHKSLLIVSIDVSGKTKTGKALRDRIHANITRWSDTKSGFPTMVVLWDHFRKNMSNLPEGILTGELSSDMKDQIAAGGYAKELTAKVARKLELFNKGKANSVNDVRDLMTGKLERTMVVGASISVGGEKSVKFCPSVASIVATQKPEFATYLGSMRLQKAGKKTIDGLEDMMFERLNRWSAENKGSLPTSILYYRDRVSESDFAMIRNDETQQIAAAWERVKSKKAKDSKNRDGPKITIVAISKGTRTRFLTGALSDQEEKFGKAGLSEAWRHDSRKGLVVDSPLTRKKELETYDFDFNLQLLPHDHHRTRSTTYFVLRNEMKLTKEEVERVTYRLSLDKTPGSRPPYVAPPYHASQLCERGQRYLWGYFSGNVGSRAVCCDPEDVMNRIREEGAWPTQPGNYKNPWKETLSQKVFWL